MHTRTVATAI